MSLWTACYNGVHVWLYAASHADADPLPGTRCDCGACTEKRA